MKTRITTFVFTLTILSLTTAGVSAQLPATQSSPLPTEEQEQAQADREEKAFALLDQVVNEAQMLRLTENRIRIQIGVADLLWARNEGRARSLFSLAAEGVGELMRNNTEATDQRRGGNFNRNASQLRQELVQTAARHNAPLAYQLLAATRPLTPPADSNNSQRFDPEQNLEQSLLARVAELDPEYALQNAEQLLEKGQYPRSITEVLTQLQLKDKDAATKLEDKVVKKLRSENLLTNVEASGLAISLLQPGPRTGEAVPATTQGRRPVLAQSTYQDLLGVMIDAALKVNPPAGGTPRRTQRGRGQGGNQTTPPSQPTEAQIEQRNAMRMIGSFRSLMPQVEQYAPSRSAALRQKLTELGLGDTRQGNRAQLATLMQQATTDSLVSAAATAPPAAQARIYQQAAMKALEEGNPERARQIANDHLEEGRRLSVLRTIEYRQLASTTEANKIDQVRNALASLPNDAARVDLLVRLADGIRKQNPEVALDLLNQAREYTNRRATGYEQFEMQLRVAAVYRELESARSFEILEPGIMQLNELMSAAAVLSGFETNVFRDGEMPLQGGNRLGDMVRRYAQEIGRLSTSDFERAQTLVTRFQFSEPRIVARMAIVRALLGNDVGPDNNRRRTGPGPFVIDNINRRDQ